MQYMEVSKKRKVIFNVYKQNKNYFVNAFDVVDYIVEFYKQHPVMSDWFPKTRLFYLMYLYQLCAFIKPTLPKIDDVFVIQNPGMPNERVEPQEVSKKLAKIPEDQDLTRVIKPIHSDIYLLDRRQHLQVERFLKEFLTLTRTRPLYHIIREIRKSPPYRNANKDGIITFSKEGVICYKPESKNIEDILKSILIPYHSTRNLCNSSSSLGGNLSSSLACRE